MKNINYYARFLPLVVGVLLFIVVGTQVASLQVSEASTLSMLDNPQIQTSECRPGDGWMWTYGSMRPEIANQAQQTLDSIGIDANITARDFGETDSCGNLRLYAVDFSITLPDPQIVTMAEQQEIVEQIQPILTEYGKPNLGNVQITFLPSKEVFTIRPDAVTFGNSRSGEIKNQSSAFTATIGWRQIVTQDAPAGRYTHGLAYDAQRNVTVLFGGDSPSSSSRANDTWEFNGTNWTEITPVQSPPGRANIDQALVYDSARTKVVLFGGLGASGYLSDTWEYNGTMWTQITGQSPQSRDSHAMVFDSQRGLTVLFGGYSSGSRLNDTWEYTGTWHQVSPSQSPAGRYHHTMAYDANRNRTILFGGLDSSNVVLSDTWEYDGMTWHNITPTLSPPARHNHSMTYDSNRGVTVLFGGEDASGLLTDTWEYNGTTWQLVTVTQAPSPRKEMPLVYDQQRDSILFFGGGYWNGSLVTFNETWEYVNTSSGQIFLPLVMRTYTPSETITRKVYVIAYNPILSNTQSLSDYLNWNEHTDLTQGTVDFFRQVTDNSLNYEIVYTTIVTDGWPEKMDGFRYTEAEYLAAIRGEAPFHTPDAVDYNKIVNSAVFDICGRANRGEIDEVWIYNGPGFGFYESTLVGPNAYWYNSPPVPGPHTCNRLIPIMGPSPERGLNCAVENFGHRTESTMVQVYGSWQQNRTAHNWERFALVKALSPDYSYSGCGNVHYAPNDVINNDYGNPATVLSNCDDFANYPNLGNPLDTAVPVTCSRWNCDYLDYFGFWFGHLPSNSGCGADSVANNWWKYFSTPALALDPSAPCQ
jgi:hypothetical protein